MMSPVPAPSPGEPTTPSPGEPTTPSPGEPTTPSPGEPTTPTGRKPLIGLTGRRKQTGAIEGFPPSLAHLDIDLYLTDYTRAVLEAGGLPVHLALDVPADEIVEHLDGVLLSGGADIDPGRYGAPVHDATVGVEPERDVHELAVFTAARRRGIPVLGICRGLQLANVACGGTLNQDVAPHARYDVAPETETHDVELMPGSALHRIYGPSHSVNSLHHQTVDTMGEDLIVTARASDGTVEGLESTDGRLVCVQWHPEMMRGRAEDPLFRWLVTATG